jgi:hypothetical protein
MALDIEGIKGRLAAATSGPWELRERTEAVSGRVDTLFAYVTPTIGPPIIEMTMDIETGQWVPLVSREDATFIAAAPADIRDLLAEVESLRAAAHEVVTLADAAGPDTFWTRWNDLAEAVDKLREVVGL